MHLENERRLNGKYLFTAEVKFNPWLWPCKWKESNLDISRIFSKAVQSGNIYRSWIGNHVIMDLEIAHNNNFVTSRRSYINKSNYEKSYLGFQINGKTVFDFQWPLWAKGQFSKSSKLSIHIKGELPYCRRYSCYRKDLGIYSHINEAAWNNNNDTMYTNIRDHVSTCKIIKIWKKMSIEKLYKAFCRSW